MWNIQRFEMVWKSHKVIRMQIHLPDMQMVLFEENQEEQAIEYANLRNTKLTSWFNKNQNDTEARQYLYCEFGQNYVWKNNNWHKRVRISFDIVYVY